ncbi:MAG: HAD family phosphatase [Acidobacteriota bacterium]|nr:HAD family phosphatase [Acidobacteriota bacterium]
MLRAILFDFNGVLVDDEPLHFELFRKVLAEEDIELSEEDYYREYVGYDDRACFQAILEAHGRPAELPQMMRLITRKSMYYQQVIQEQGYPFFPGAEDLIRNCSDAGLMLGVVSGALREEVEGALRQAGLLDRFKILVPADDVQASKPDPEGYQRGLQGLNSLPPLPDRLIHPHEVLVLEDTPAGLEAASVLGMVTVGVAHTYPAEALKLAGKVVEGIEGLTCEDLRGFYGEVAG